MRTFCSEERRMGVVTLFRVLRACVLLLVAAVGHRRAGRTHLVAVLFTSWPKMRARVVLYLLNQERGCDVDKHRIVHSVAVIA